MTTSLNTILLKERIDYLRDRGFNFEASTPIYNPIEFFLDKLVQKETAHSKLIADLLNPNGKHGQGNRFLQALLNHLGIEFDPNNTDWNNILVKTEYYIETNLTDNNGKDENLTGRIDIYLKIPTTDSQTVHLIIENKLNNAGFQYRQLEKYYQAIQKKANKDDLIKIICMGSYLPDSPPKETTLITATKIAQMIESVFTSIPNDIRESLKCYTNYLKNKNMNDQNIDNALKLVKTSNEIKFQELKAIKEAFDSLPYAYSKEFYNKVSSAFSYPSANSYLKAEEDKYYAGYVNIWREYKNQNDKMSWRWLSVGFHIDKAKFFIVSNKRESDEELKKYVEQGKLKLYSDSQGWKWYVYDGNENLQQEILFRQGTEIQFPDFDALIEETRKYIQFMDEIDNEFVR